MEKNSEKGQRHSLEALAEKKRLISITVPVYNEEKLICKTLENINDIISKASEYFEIIVVDDGSTDNTWGKIKEKASVDSRIKLVRFTRNFGKEAAILAGLKFSKGTAVIVMDADLQHPPELLLEMISLWQTGQFDIIHAIKQRRQPESFFKRISASLFYSLMKAFSGMDLRNATDYKLLDRRVVDQYLALPEKLRFSRGLIPWLGFKNATVPFTPDIRSKDTSKWNIGSLLKLGFRAICSFSSLPLQAVTILGAIMFMVSIVLEFQTLLMKFIGKAATGFTTVIILLLFIGSVLMISLGLIGQYLAMIYEEIKGRPPYLIDKTWNIKSTIDPDGPI